MIGWCVGMLWMATLAPLLAFGSQAGKIDAAEVLEAQKHLYREGSWDAFFGASLYYRVRGDLVPGSSPLVKDHLLALELMALARHCQWQPILELEKSLVSSAEEKPLSAKALSLIRLKREFVAFAQDQSERRLGLMEAVQQSKSQWNVPESALARLTSPKNLRVHVRSQCAS